MDSVCGVIYNDHPFYFRKKLQGDVIAITEWSGETVARYTYDAWGKCTIVDLARAHEIATINPFRYRSYYYDSETQLYYLQSRYYDPETSRFLNGDDVMCLGYSGLIAYNLFAYCENNCTNYADFMGYASTPSLYMLTKMHNAVVRSAQAALMTYGILTNTEVWTCAKKGVYNGRMDIYAPIANRVWEVKRNNSAGIRAGQNQLSRYTSSYIYTLFHNWIRVKRMPRLGNRTVSGATVVDNYLVMYRSYNSNAALILYDYMSLEKAAMYLFSALTATAAVWNKMIAACTAPVRKKAQRSLALILASLKYSVKSTAQFLKYLGEFIERAWPILLTAIVVIVCVFAGIAMFA